MPPTRVIQSWRKTLQEEYAMGVTPTRTKAGGGKSGNERSVALGKADSLVAALVMLVLAGAYWVGILPEVLALVLLLAVLKTSGSRAWQVRHDGLEYGLLRNPFRRELRPHLVQCLNHWLFWALIGVVILTGAFENVPGLVAIVFGLPLPDVFPYRPLLIMLGVGAAAMAVFALVPGRRVRVATNVLVAIGTAFVAVQLMRIDAPPDEPVVVDLPLSGDWAMLAGGRSTLLSHHYLHPGESDALDFVRLVDGRGYRGDPNRAQSWHGFGEPVLAPADGTVVSVLDGQPDEPVGAIGQTPAQGNHLVLEISDGRYAMLAHLQQGSVRVGPGERVRRGQHIAAVGDSGNSLAPHLHFQVQDRPGGSEQLRTVPVVFRDVVLTRAGRESTPAGADLRRGDHVRRGVS
jgi:murein DD-endopeptidase MepM/ murein hydrolase activator NlpD